jgi:uncharacterized alpha-E superfamily protein
MKEKHKKYFDAHPKVDIFYFTTDGLAFQDKSPAESHQISLTGKVADLETVSRSTGVPVNDQPTQTQLQERLEELQKAFDDADKEDEDRLQQLIDEIEEVKKQLNQE